MRIGAGAVVVLLALLSGSPAHAGPFGDEMAKCLVNSTSEADRTLLIQWIFAAMAKHPDVSSLSNVSAEKGEELNRKVGELLGNLLTERCKSETTQALKLEGPGTFATSFEVLGRVAMQGIMSDGAVAAYLSGIAKYVDDEAMTKALDVKP